MSKRSRRRPEQRPAKQRHRRSGRAERRSRPERPDLIADVEAALGDDDPLPLLALVSSLLAALEPPRANPFDHEPEPELPGRDELVASFLDVDLVQTSALLAAMATLSGDDVLARRVGREIAEREHALPVWLAELDRAEALDRTVEVVHVLGDGDDVCVGARLPGGHELTAVVYIDHNMGTVVKDAFVLPGPLPEMIEQILTIGNDPDTVARDLDPADARVRITEAIELGAITWPPLQSESWPACRSLVEWIVRRLPEGGSGYQRHEWTDAERDELAERFLASPFAAGLDDPTHRHMLDSLLWFGTDYGPGDPLRWSPVAVEILLVDWIPRKIVARVDELAVAPEVLRAFVRFSHHERGIRAALTEETLVAVDTYEPEYQTTIRTPRPQGPAALLAAMGAVDPDAPWLEEPLQTRHILDEALGRAVGGVDALDGLDASPLPDEPFDWAGIPDDVHDRVAEVLTLVDRCCDGLLGTEARTACRRLLSRAAAEDPEIFRRRGRADTAAAAVCWVIGKANDMFRPWDGLLVKDLVAHFGTAQGNLSGRSAPLLRAIGVDPGAQFGAMDLGSPDYLTAERRAELIASRDAYRSIPTGGDPQR